VPFTQAVVVGFKSFSKTHLTLVECPNSITTRVDLKTEPTLQIIKWLATATTLVVALALFSVATAQQTSPSIENAKKEGEVIWYGTLTGGSIVGRIIGAFESKYPFIKVKYLRLGGAGLIERIRSEARSGKYLWDIVTAEYIQFFELPKVRSACEVHATRICSVFTKTSGP
jgi:hypothetical protein